MITELPAEILEKVFRALGPADRKTVVQVCRRWRTVCEHPSLWSWVTVCLDKSVRTSVHEVVASRRFRDITSLTVTDQVVTKKLLLKIKKWKKLEILEIRTKNIQTLLNMWSIRFNTKNIQTICRMWESRFNMLKQIQLTIKEDTDGEMERMMPTLMDEENEIPCEQDSIVRKSCRMNRAPDRLVMSWSGQIYGGRDGKDGM